MVSSVEAIKLTRPLSGSSTTLENEERSDAVVSSPP